MNFEHVLVQIFRNLTAESLNWKMVLMFAVKIRKLLF